MPLRFDRRRLAGNACVPRSAPIEPGRRRRAIRGSGPGASMNGDASWALAQEDYRAALEGIAALDQAVPAFAGQARAFRVPIDDFLASDAAVTAGGLARLARTLQAQAALLSCARQAILSHVAMAKASLRRYQAHLQAADDGRDAFRRLKRIIEDATQGISATEDLLADADRLLQEAAAHLLEGALKYDLPPAVEQLARHLIDRARA